MPLYRIIDTNQKERGPFDAERICVRIADGRSDAQTKARIEGTDEWRRLGDLPEFAEALKQGELPPPMPSAPSAASKTSSPAAAVPESVLGPTRLGWLDQQFLNTPGWLSAVAVLCLTPVMLLVGILGIVGCEDPRARKSAILMTIACAISIALCLAFNAYYTRQMREIEQIFHQ
jgi:hypothetical protein